MNIDETLRIDDETLGRYLDGELGPVMTRHVEQAAADNPLVRRRLERMRAQSNLLRRYFAASEESLDDARVAETVRLVCDHRPQRRSGGGSVRQAALSAAAAVVLLAVGAAGLLRPDPAESVPSFADAAAVAYLAAASDPPASADEEHLSPASIIQVLDAYAGLDIHAPHFEEHGFFLTEGRLARFDGHAAVLLMYEHENDPTHRVGVYLTEVGAAADSLHTAAEDRGVHVKYWTENGIGIVISASHRQDFDDFTKAAEPLIHAAKLPLRFPQG
jgi:anti-sigma factor RsiW